MYQKVVIELDFENINKESINVNREEVAEELRLMEIQPFNRTVAFRNSPIELDIRRRSRRRWMNEKMDENPKWTKRSTKYTLLRSNKF